MEIVLAHGASGSAASMRKHVEGLVTRGLQARAIDLPVRRAETATGAYAAAAGALGTRVIGGQSYGGRVASLLAAEVAGEPGGQSYGGRVASLLAAEVAGEPGATAAPDGPAGLVLFSYPLHRPGSPERTARTSHWAALRCPVLFLSGESDPFARIDLLRESIAELLPDARLVTWPRLGHSLVPVLDEALDRVAAFVGELAGPAPA